MPLDTAHRRLGLTLPSAARRKGELPGGAEAGSRAEAEGLSLLARLGLPLADPAGWTGSERGTAVERLGTESRRLARFARARHPAYDINRHIAVRRLLAALAPAFLIPSAACSKTSASCKAGDTGYPAPKRPPSRLARSGSLLPSA